MFLMEAEQPKMYFQAIILILNNAGHEKACLISYINNKGLVIDTVDSY